MKKVSRLPGFLYLGMILFGICAQIIRSNVFVPVPGDAAEALEKISGSLFMLRLAFMSDLLMMVFFLFTAWELFNILKNINISQSLLFLILAVISVAVMSGNMLNHIAVIEMNGSAYFKTYDLNSLSLFYLNMHKYGYLIAQIFFGLWLFPLGLVIIQSKIMPRYFGIMLIAATFGHLAEIVITFLFPGNALLTYPGLLLAMAGEFSFCFWLLFKGIDIEKMTGSGV